MTSAVGSSNEVIGRFYWVRKYEIVIELSRLCMTFLILEEDCLQFSGAHSEDWHTEIVVFDNTSFDS